MRSVLSPAGAIRAEAAGFQIYGTMSFYGNSAGDSGGGYVGVSVMLAT